MKVDLNELNKLVEQRHVSVQKHPQLYKRINKDDLRAMIDGGKWSPKNEKFIIEMRDWMVDLAMLSGYNVIVDDTNYNQKHEAALREKVRKWNEQLLMPGDKPDFVFEVKDFSDVSPEECVKRNLQRAHPVPEKIIWDMWKKYIKPSPKVVKDNSSLPTCVICDIDGTLALFGDANPYERDFTKDTPNMRIYELLHRLSDDRTIMLVSGRQDKYREQTMKWLDMHGIPYHRLFMRKTDDLRKDTIVKREIYNREINGKYNVLFVLDDRNSVVDMWRQEGLTCLQVAEGDF